MVAALTVLKTILNPKRKARTLSTRSGTCLHGSTERGPSAWAHPFKEGAIGFAGFDHGVNGACHLCGNGGVSLAAQIWVVTVLRDVAFERNRPIGTACQMLPLWAKTRA